MDEIGVAALSSFLSVAFDAMGTQEYEKFLNSRQFSYERIKELETKMIALSSMVDDAEEKQFAKENVKEWLLELKDATHEAEDLLDGIQIAYQAHQSKAVDEDQERSSTSQDPLKQEPELQEILEKLEDLMKKSASLGLSKKETTSSSARPLSFDFYVFLNFRGDDVRYNFVHYLKEALKKAEIKPFYDSEDLDKGEEIATILKKIEVSKMSIMIFSEDYASSSYCLDELAKILDCKETWGHKALPVFYKVPPDVVANQSGIYAEAFRRHEEKDTDREKVRTWRASLEEAADLSGFVIENTRPEEYDIQDIVKAVKKMLRV